MPPEPSADAKPRFGMVDVVILAVFLALLAAGVYGIYRYVRQITTMGWDRFWDAVLYALLQIPLIVATGLAFVVVAGAILAILSILTGMRLRRPRVFISFQHRFEALARAIEADLSPHLTVLRIPFVEGRDHDDVIAESLDAVRRADAVIAIPGPDASWMANELGLAVGSKKPVIVIRHLPDQKLSDSLYRGYPVFDWAAVQERGLDGLIRFTTFAAKSVTDLPSYYRRVFAGFGVLFGKLAFAWWIVGVLVKTAVDFIAVWIDLESALRASGAVFWGHFAFFALVFVVACGRAVAKRARGIRIARQKIKTRDATFDELATVFGDSDGDRRILELLEREPLRPRHEQ